MNKRYLIEVDGICIKEYKRKNLAIKFAQEYAKKHDDGKSLFVAVHECRGRFSSVIWSNSPIA